MKLIHFQGLNCYHDCMITLANTFGLNYTAAFSGLWAEGRLRYDPICDVFLSMRLEEALEDCGMKLDAPWITKKERETGWADTPAGDYIIIGMDAFLIPWNPLCELLHGPHYFIVQKGISETHDCFDPTYGLDGQKLTTRDLILNTYALITIKMINKTNSFIADKQDPLLNQSQEVLKTHPETLRYLLKQAKVWMQESEKSVLLPAKYVDALLTGRYLYRFFLKERNMTASSAPLFFSRKYYEQWLTVKNGFYKAALSRQSSAAFNESCRLLTCLFEKEIDMARQIISLESKDSNQTLS